MSGLKVAVLPVTALQQNCTLVTDAATGRTAVIDPGGDADAILATLSANALDAEAIWLTHGHLDHAGGAMELAEKLNLRPGRTAIEIVGPDRRDDMLLASIEQQARYFGLSGLRNVVPTCFLEEGETVSVGPHVFEVLHCPGHTPGHVVFVNRAARFAQLGDVLFRGSVGRTDFPYGDHAALISAIKTKILPLGDDMRFVCGHGPSSSIGAERATNPFIQ
jgi:glyoxylase-like metal-dependent hydrolase (beta-lactamase superfamily II)